MTDPVTYPKANRRNRKERHEVDNAPMDHMPTGQIAALVKDLSRAKEALGCISRMKIFPDHQINMMTLHAAIRLAEKALNP